MSMQWAAPPAVGCRGIAVRSCRAYTDPSRQWFIVVDEACPHQQIVAAGPTDRPWLHSWRYGMATALCFRCRSFQVTGSTVGVEYGWGCCDP